MNSTKFFVDYSMKGRVDKFNSKIDKVIYYAKINGARMSIS